MGTPDDSKIGKTLRKAVQELRRDGSEVTTNTARRRAEKKLNFEEGFLNNKLWKSRSKAIVQTAFEEPELESESPAEKEEKSQPKPQKKSKNNEERKESGFTANDVPNPQAPKPPQITASQANGVKRKAGEVEPVSGSVGGESTSSADEDSEQSPRKKAKADSTAVPQERGKPAAASTTSSDESSGEETESESGSGSDSDSEDSRPSPSQGKAANVPQSELTARAIPSKTFEPPSGYRAIDSAALASSERPFSNNLEGKQIWHITAPSHVPVSSLSELALSFIQSGDAVISHKNVSYVLSEDRAADGVSTTVFAPDREGYRKIQLRTSRTLRLQQKIDLPNLSYLQASQQTGSHAAGDVAQASMTAVRPQPKGLRMRYKPPGFGKGRPGRIGSGSESGEEEEEEEDGPSFQFPKSLGQHGVEVKQDGDVEMVDAADIDSNGGKSEKKAKKKRKDRASGDAGAEKQSVNGLPDIENDAKTNSTTEAPGGALLNGSETKAESKEEKRRRKEEKRARKEAKAKAK